MGIHQKGIVLFRVLRSEEGHWNVLEGDFDDPLASFMERQDACDYANKLSMERDGATVIILDEAVVLSEKNRKAPGHVFKA